MNCYHGSQRRKMRRLSSAAHPALTGLRHSGVVHPDLALLTGDDAGDILDAAVTTAGGELRQWRAVQVDHRPESSTTVSYSAQVQWADRCQEETLAASTGDLASADPLPGVLILGDGERRVAVWRFPADPALPALARACDAAAVAALLDSVGLPGGDPAGADLSLRTRTYRPGRRAVLEVARPGGRLFLKVVKPGSVRQLHERHRLLADAGIPVPQSLGWTDDGLLVLQALPGQPLRTLLLDAAAATPIPSGVQVFGLLDAFPPQAMELPRRTPWAEHAGHYAAVVAAALPGEADRSRRLGQSIAEAIGDQPPDSVTHGDFYEAQLLVTASVVTGILDVDTVGPGRRADDLACMLAHIAVLGLIAPSALPRLRQVLRQWHSAAAQVVDPAELAARTAGVLLSLATGPHRVQERQWQHATTLRLDEAQRWLDAAGGRSHEHLR